MTVGFGGGVVMRFGLGGQPYAMAALRRLGRPTKVRTIRRLFADTGPLRSSRDYRLLFIGQGFSAIGSQLTVVAAPVQVFALTGSTLMVGLLGLVQFPALFLGSLIGGVLSDSRDRRLVFMWAQLLLAASTAGLALNASASSESVAIVFVLTALNAFLSGIDSPARTAAVPRVVSAAELPAALALQVLLFQTALAVGPAAAGLIISAWSPAAAFWLDVASYGAAIVAVMLMSPLPPSEQHGARSGLGSVLEGLRFLRSKDELKGVFLIDINAMVLGLPRALFPEFGLEVFNGSEATVGYLFAAPGVGAMVAALVSGWVGRVRRLGRGDDVGRHRVGSRCSWLGLSPWLWPALVFLALAGAGDAISAVFRSTMLQLTTPDRLRGRLSAVQIAVVTGGPRVGDAESGLVAAALGARVSAWTEGWGPPSEPCSSRGRCRPSAIGRDPDPRAFRTPIRKLRAKSHPGRGADPNWGCN